MFEVAHTVAVYNDDIILIVDFERDYFGYRKFCRTNLRQISTNERRNYDHIPFRFRCRLSRRSEDDILAIYSKQNRPKISHYVVGSLLRRRQRIYIRLYGFGRGR